MSGSNKVARNLLMQEPGRVDCYANAANAHTVTQQAPARHNGDNVNAIMATGGITSKQQVSRLMQAHGLTMTQARTVAALAWRAVQ